MIHKRNRHKKQGSQTYPGGPSNAHSTFQTGTQCSRVRRFPQIMNCGVTFTSRRTKEAHSSKITKVVESIGRPDIAHSRYQPMTHTPLNTKTATSMEL